jgi:hypothetical protein
MQDNTNIEYTHRQISMPWVGFESTIPAFVRVKTVDVLDRAAIVIGYKLHYKEANFG